MRFKIISAGWNCAPFIERTLDSVLGQSQGNWDIGIAVDPCDDGTVDIALAWKAAVEGLVDGRVYLQVNEQRQGAVRNQVELIEALDPDDDDVIVFLDLDGDQLAHQDVLKHLEGYYTGDTLVTYGNYRPVPDNPGCQPPKPFPPEVVRDRTYREHILRRYCCFNHLRTMKGRVFKAIPRDHFTYLTGSTAGEWYTAGTDYVFMMAALEIADGRYRCIDEVLCLYNAANPHADNIHHPQESTRCHMDILRRPPLPPLVVA